jgi:hypothetical protein
MKGKLGEVRDPMHLLGRKGAPDRGMEGDAEEKGEG